MKVLFVSTSLGCGGAERNVAMLACSLARRGHAVHVATFADADDFYPLSSSIPRTRLSAERPTASVAGALAHNAIKVFKLSRLLQAAQPDVLVSSGDRTNVVALLAGLWTRKPVVCNEVSFNWAARPRGWRTLERALYPHADALVSASHAVCAQFSFVRPDKRHVIHSALELPNCSVPEVRRPKVVLYVGRLHAVKNLGMLVQAFAAATANNPDWVLRVVGEGPEHDALVSQSHALGLAGRVQFVGAVKDVAAQYRNAAIAVLSSHSEGFGNVLVEAQAHGCAVLSTDCGGPRDIIEHGVTGVLSPSGDVEAFALALGGLMADDELRARLARAGRQATERFSLSAVTDRWEALLRSIVER